MDQLHRRFTAEQLKVLLEGYGQGRLDRAGVEEMLGIGKTRFFALLKEYRRNPKTFSLSYERATPPKLSAATELEIAKELLRDKELVEDKRLPISGYNYSALRDRLRKNGIDVSLTTIIRRAKNMDCYKAHPKAKAHDREVLTASIGALVQHDASIHLWSPYAQDNQELLQTYSIPLRYYVDSLRVFRFVQGRDSVWRKHVLQTDEVDPQWRQVMRALGVDVTYALSPQAKGKVERPFRWLQDRIVRTCALERLSTINEVRAILKEEVDRYNNHQVHSTTKEVPNMRFDSAAREGNSLFRPLGLPKPYTSLKDVFCLREKRTINGYRRISLFNHDIEVPNVPLREDVEVHLVPDQTRQTLEIRIWWRNKMVHSVSYPLKDFPRVHFSSVPNRGISPPGVPRSARVAGGKHGPRPHREGVSPVAIKVTNRRSLQQLLRWQSVAARQDRRWRS